MMIERTPFLTLEGSCVDAVNWATDKVRTAGLSVIRTFDLQDARDPRVPCPCPYHGTNDCDCQLVVLLIYMSGHNPISLIAHGHNGQTWFSIVDSPQQRPDPQLDATLRDLLSIPLIPPQKS